MMRAFNVWFFRDLLDTVFYSEDMDEMDVYLELTKSGDFPSEIRVEEVAL